MGYVWILFGINGIEIKQTPVLGTGIKTVGKVAFLNLTTLPYGELIVFTMVWPLLKDRRKVKTVGR
ncbi:GerAB/ArcD/ProY family transporter [Ectobacillus funiculus]|uniref:GerAB/ArcD/ProY family transporter n=1 Tax=Ectobacillus funiculus TaxID=137993 RepID=UPI0039790453